MLSISIGPLSLPVNTAFTVFMILSFWSLTYLFTRNKIKAGKATDHIFSAVLVGVLAARVVFVLALWDVYQQNWLSIIDIRDGGFNAPLGWFAGIMFLMFASRGKREQMSAYLKAAGIALAISTPLFFANLLLSKDQTLSPLPLEDAKGNSVNLEEFTGKPVVINFWASWCPPCRREMPVFVAAEQEYTDVMFVFVNQQESPAKALRFLSENNLQLQNVFFDPMGLAAQDVGVSGLPSTLFFDSDGHLISSHMGELSKATLSHYLQKFQSDSAQF